MESQSRTLRTCLRCSWQWFSFPSNPSPTICPKCKSAYWNKPRKEKRDQAEKG